MKGKRFAEEQIIGVLAARGRWNKKTASTIS
jgi:hypothetical protein